MARKEGGPRRPPVSGPARTALAVLSVVSNPAIGIVGAGVQHVAARALAPSGRECTEGNAYPLVSLAIWGGAVAMLSGGGAVPVALAWISGLAGWLSFPGICREYWSDRAGERRECDAPAACGRVRMSRTFRKATIVELRDEIEDADGSTMAQVAREVLDTGPVDVTYM